MIELALYVVIGAAAIFYSVFPRVGRDTTFLIVWSVFYLCLTLVVRNNFQGDISVYAASFRYSSFSFYYLREPVVWLGGRVLYSLFSDEQLVFVVLDCVVGIFLLSALIRVGAPRYTFFAILCFFPFILGMQNVYRQHLATVFLISAFSFDRKSTFFLPVFHFCLAVASHNAAAVFLPVLVLRRKSTRSFWFIFSLCIAVFGVVYGAGSKSLTTIGKDLGVVYVMFFVFVLFLHISLDRYKLAKKDFAKYAVLIFYVFIIVVGYFSLGGSGRERLGMMAMMLMYVPLAIFLERRIVQRGLTSGLVSVLGFVPLFLFETRAFIFN